VLLADYVNFQRAAHLEYVALPGGEARDSRALAHRGELPRETLRQALAGPEIPFVKDLDRRNLDILLQMIERGVNSPLTSSCGRLFDAVAALIGLRTTVNYEAQAAIELEMAAHESTDESAYPFDLQLTGETWRIGTHSLFDWLLRDIRRECAPRTSAAGFTMAWRRYFSACGETSRIAWAESRMPQRRLFSEYSVVPAAACRAAQTEFEVYFHTEVPAGDGASAWGRPLVAAHRLRITESSS